mgnify:CR=1 FL=1
MNVLKDGIETQIKLTELKDEYFISQAVLKSGLLKLDPKKQKYTWSLYVIGIKLITPSESELTKLKKVNVNSYELGMAFCKAL